MRAVVYEDIGKVRVDEVDPPAVEDEADAVVRITTAAICGSDLHFYHGKAPLMPGDPLGHEGVGMVEEVGSGVSSVRPGDRVVIAFDNACGDCWFCGGGLTSLCEGFANLGAGILGGGLGGAQAEYVRVPNADVNLLALPDDLDDERAIFLGDVLTTGYYGAAIAGIRPGDTVAVVGAGTVGYFAAQAAALHDPGRVLVLDLEDDRLALAEGIGATPIHVQRQNPSTAVDGHTDGRGADVVIEAVGDVTALETALRIVRRGGRISIIGMYVTETMELQIGAVWSQMLSLIFGGVCPVHAWWREALGAVVEGRIDPLPIISHRMSLDEAPAGYELFDRREASKVVLRP